MVGASAMEPLQGRGEAEAEAGGALEERVEGGGDVGVRVVQEEDVPALERLLLEEAPDGCGRAAREVLGVAVPQDDRLAQAPQADELPRRELAVRGAEE